jgi:hypothetical protein
LRFPIEITLYLAQCLRQVKRLTNTPMGVNLYI